MNPVQGITEGNVQHQHVSPGQTAQALTICPRQRDLPSNHIPNPQSNQHFSVQHRSDGREQCDELGALRDSHSALARQMCELQDQMRGTQDHFETERVTILNHLRANDDYCVYRIIMFAQLRPTKMLQGLGTELGRKVGCVVKVNSVVPILLRSPSADCTLSDFQTLALHLLNTSGARCFAFPSEYHIKFPSLRHCSRLQVVFYNYADICEALQLDMSTREQAVYREKRNSSKQLLASQVMGSHVIRSSTRSIVIGFSSPTAQGTGSVPTLFQDSISWEDPTWESDFKFRNEPCSAFSNATQRSSTSDHKQQFSLNWERLQECGGHMRRSKSIPGSLRTFFPAVVLRTNILTMSARNIFQNQVNAVTVLPLKKVIATPSTSY